MNEFWLYFETGFEHIIEFSGNLMGMDHILFLVALCIRYQFADWRKLLILITAFTIGHSISLVLSVFNLIRYSTQWIEFLIPVTILITGISNVFVKKFVFKSRFSWIYLLAVFFGWVHGLGFSSYLKSILGKDENVVWELLAFNIGLELGQILIVASVLLISFIFVQILRCNRREWVLWVTGGVFFIALQMAIERIPY